MTLQPLDYYNGGSLDYGGSCCDLLCLTECDNWFKFCITAFPVSDFRYCRLYAVTRVLGDDDFHFPGYGQSIGNNVNNPLRYRASDPWPVSDSNLRTMIHLIFSRIYFRCNDS